MKADDNEGDAQSAMDSLSNTVGEKIEQEHTQLKNATEFAAKAIILMAVKKEYNLLFALAAATARIDVVRRAMIYYFDETWNRTAPVIAQSIAQKAVVSMQNDMWDPVWNVIIHKEGLSLKPLSAAARC